MTAAVQSHATIDSWNGADDYQITMIRGLLKEFIVKRLGSGHHHFDSMYEILDLVGVRHFAWPQICVRILTQAQLLRAAESCEHVFFMSVRSFARIVHEMSGVRLQTNSWYSVERGDLPRHILVVD